MGAESVAQRYLQARPAGELAGVNTYVTLRSQKGLPPSTEGASRLPGESPRSTRDQAAPQPPSTAPEGKTRVLPVPLGYQGPSAGVGVRTPGVPGEQYGHPFKGGDPGQRRVADFYLERFPNWGGGLGAPSEFNPTYRSPDQEEQRPADRKPDWGGPVPLVRSARRVAAQYEAIVRGLDPAIDQRGARLRPTLQGGPPGLRRYAVRGSGDTYQVSVAYQGEGPWRERDLRVSCTCEFWRWQGPEHWARAGSYLYGKPQGTAARPAERDPENRHRVCKHVAAVLRSLMAGG